MKRVLTGSLLILFAGESLLLAGNEGSSPCCAPTVPIPNVRLYQQPPPPPPRCGPTTPIPAPTFYRAEVKPPVCGPVLPLPPVRLYSAHPPCVTLVALKPPPVTFYRQEPEPARCLPPPSPLPTVMLYRSEVNCSEYRPSVPIPNVTFFRQVALCPSCPSCPAPAEAGCSGEAR